MSKNNGHSEYVYNVAGRRMAKIVDNIATYYVYNASYQVIQERNAANRLIRVEDELTQVVVAEYCYDPFGRRLWKDVQGSESISSTVRKA